LKLSLILPVYNPADGWADIVISKTKELITLHPGIDFEFIVVNDGSVSKTYADATYKFADDLIKLIEYQPNRGKGEALRTGVRASSGEIIVYTDIDFPYTIESVSEVINILSHKDANVVIGVKDSSYYTQVPPIRRFISRVFRFFVRLFLRIPTDDTQCGLKGFDQKGKEIFLKTAIDRYLFDLEFVFLVSRDRTIRLKMQEIQLREDVQFRKMNFGIIVDELGNFFKVFIKAIF
jgi:glycosyltransferase involved in cell wall biosynthesis